MRRPKVLMLAMFLLLAAGPACGDDDGPDRSAGTATEPAAADDPGDATVLTVEQPEAEVEVGERVVVELDENQSIGDLWEVADPPDEEVLALVDETYDVDDPGTEGGGGTARFVFEAVGEGATGFVMHNCYRCDADGESTEENPDTPDIEFTVEVSA